MLRRATRLERLEDRVAVAALACSAAALAWLAARWVGWRPPSPLLVGARGAGFVTLFLLAAAEALRFIARARAREADRVGPALLRWTRLSLGVAGAGVVLARAALLIGGHGDMYATIGRAVGPIAAVLGLAALLDAADGRRRRSLSAVGIAGTAVGGVGALLVALSALGEPAVPDAVSRWLIVVAFFCVVGASGCYLAARCQSAAQPGPVSGA
jgi:hypothetical protein